MIELSIAAFARPFFKIYEGDRNILKAVSLIDLSVNI